MLVVCGMGVVCVRQLPAASSSKLRAASIDLGEFTGELECEHAPNGLRYSSSTSLRVPDAELAGAHVNDGGARVAPCFKDKRPSNEMPRGV